MIKTDQTLRLAALAALFPLLLGAATPRAECRISYNASSKLTDIIKERGFGIEKGVYDSLCANLQRDQLGVDFESHGSVLEGRAIGYVSAKLYDKATLIVSPRYTQTTRVVNEPSSPAERDALHGAMARALEGVQKNYAAQAEALTAEKARLRKVLLENPQ